MRTVDHQNINYFHVLYMSNRCVQEFAECLIMSCFIIKTFVTRALIVITITLFYILSFLHVGNPNFPK